VLKESIKSTGTRFSGSGTRDARMVKREGMLSVDLSCSILRTENIYRTNLAGK